VNTLIEILNHLSNEVILVSFITVLATAVIFTFQTTTPE